MSYNIKELNFSIDFTLDSYACVNIMKIEEAFDDSWARSCIFADMNNIETEDKMFPTKLDALKYVQKKVEEQIKQLVEE